MPTRLAELQLSRDEPPRVLDASLENFNADPKREFVSERVPGSSAGQGMVAVRLAKRQASQIGAGDSKDVGS